MHEALNGALAQAAARHDTRVRFVDVALLFEGHEAGDALGPDWLRDPIETVLGVQVRAYCSEEGPHRIVDQLIRLRAPHRRRHGRHCRGDGGRVDGTAVLRSRNAPQVWSAGSPAAAYSCQRFL